jgi:hypothetical protein
MAEKGCRSCIGIVLYEWAGVDIAGDSLQGIGE